jgi:hypothetical protein
MAADFIFHSQSRFPDNKLTVAILTNISPPEANLNANAIILLGKNAVPTSIRAVILSQDLKMFEGRYDFRNEAVIVTRRMDCLHNSRDKGFHFCQDPIIF